MTFGREVLDVRQEEDFAKIRLLMATLFTFLLVITPISGSSSVDPLQELLTPLSYVDPDGGHEGLRGVEGRGLGIGGGGRGSEGEGARTRFVRGSGAGFVGGDDGFKSDSGGIGIGGSVVDLRRGGLTVRSGREGKVIYDDDGGGTFVNQGLDGPFPAEIPTDHHSSRRTNVVEEDPGLDVGPLVAVTVEKGATARLPCNFQPVHHNDQVQLILWYRNGTSRPFLSHDSRSDFEPPESGVASSSSSSSSSTSLSASSSSVLSPSNAYADSFNRLSASVGTEMEGRMSLGKGGRILILRQVTDKDGAEYRCKVHFRLSPTWTQRLLLRVSSSLTSVHLTGINGEAVGRRIGPYPEGASLGLICEANYTGILDGLRWTLDGKELDSTWQRKRDGVVINQLTIESLERRHLHADLTCQLRCRGPEGTGIKANITHASTTIDMFFAPSRVEIWSPGSWQSAGRTYEIICNVHGGSPRPAVSWWIGPDRVDNRLVQTRVLGNVTESTVKLTPDIEDNENVLRCRADSPLTDPVQDDLPLNVHYVPRATIVVEWGSGSLGGSNGEVTEGGAVTFRCVVRANPPPYNITWLHKGRVLDLNSRRFSMGNGSLTLLRISRKDSGLYTCLASNSEGDGQSNAIFLPVRHTPYCKGLTHNELIVVRNDTVTVSCEVEADPPEVTFSWKAISSSGGPPPSSKYDLSSGGGVITGESSFAGVQAKGGSGGAYSSMNDGGVSVVGSPHSGEYNLLGGIGGLGLGGGVGVGSESYPSRPNINLIDLTPVEDNKWGEKSFHTFGRSSGETFEREPPYSVFSGGSAGSPGVVAGLPSAAASSSGGIGRGAGAGLDPEGSSVEFVVDSKNPRRSHVLFSSAEAGDTEFVCFAINKVGKQEVPCRFFVKVVDRPRPLENCTITMVDVSSLEVECGGGSPHTPSPGHDHAPDPSYVRSSDVRTRATLEVWLRDSGTLVTNTSDDRGRFIVKGLQPDTDFELVLYASNHNGRSEPVYMYSKTQPRKIPPLPPGTPGDDEGDRGMGEGREGGTKGSSHEDGGGSIAKVVGGLVGGLGGSVLLLVLLVVLVKWRQRRRGGGADVSGVDEPEVQRLNMDPLLGVTPPWSTTTISESTPVMPPPTTSDAAGTDVQFSVDIHTADMK